MKDHYLLRVFHENGHWGNSQRQCGHLQSNKTQYLDRYDDFEVQFEAGKSPSPIKEVIFWNRIYKMQNGRKPVMPLRIEKWVAGEYEVINFSPAFFKIVNWVLCRLPKKLIRYRYRWQYNRFFGM